MFCNKLNKPINSELPDNELQSLTITLRVVKLNLSLYWYMTIALSWWYLQFMSDDYWEQLGDDKPYEQVNHKTSTSNKLVY